MGYQKSTKFKEMTRNDRTRLRREWEYIRGCMEMLSWVQLQNPTDEQIEGVLDAMQGRKETIDTTLKMIDTQEKKTVKNQ